MRSSQKATMQRVDADNFADQRRWWRLDIRHLIRTDEPQSPAVEASLADAERKGFRLAVIGRHLGGHHQQKKGRPSSDERPSSGPKPVGRKACQIRHDSDLAYPG